MGLYFQYFRSLKNRYLLFDHLNLFVCCLLSRTGVLSNIAMGYIQIPNIAMGGYFCNYTTSGYICNKCKVAISMKICCVESEIPNIAKVV